MPLRRRLADVALLFLAANTPSPPEPIYGGESLVAPPSLVSWLLSGEDVCSSCVVVNSCDSVELLRRATVLGLPQSRMGVYNPGRLG